MVNFCAVYGCHNKAGRDEVSFYRFPAVNSRFKAEIQRLQRKRRRAWIVALKRKDVSDDKCNNYRVCSLHFIKGKPAELADETNPDWIPCQHLGRRKKDAQMADCERHQRALDRSRRSQTQISIQFEDEHNVNADMCDENAADMSNIVNDTGVHSQTDLTCNDIRGLEMELRNANLERYRLRDLLSSLLFTEDGLAKQPEKLRFYTGLPNAEALKTLLEIVTPSISTTFVSTLTAFQQLLLTMMKLRLNLSFVDLGYRFGVSNSTASRIFNNLIRVMYVGLRRFVPKDVESKSKSDKIKKKFSILNETIPKKGHEKSALADEITLVCCACFNIGQSVNVPLDQRINASQ